jgi:DNA-binding XRE family transcriptional regulator
MSFEAGHRIKDVRKELGATQTEFAQRLGMKWFRLRDLESGRLNTNEEIAKLINREFGINYRWILTGEEPREYPLVEREVVATINAASPFIEIYDAGLLSKLSHAYNKCTSDTKSELTEEPIRTVVSMEVYFNNPNIINEVFLRAKGVCESCKQPAPFNRASDNSPYLEVHHILPLSTGGADSSANVMAVCPNCHKKLHFGKPDSD